MQRAARVIAAAVAAMALLIFAAGLSPAASALGGAAAPQPQPLWLVKSNDLVDLAQQAEADGVTLPAFTWIGCGGLSDFDQCLPGQVPIFTSYWQLYAQAEAGWRGTALFDIETWTMTPRAQRLDPDKWICMAAQLSRTDPNLRVIITPLTKPPVSRMISEDVVAARCRAYAVDLQTQFANGSPRLFGSIVRTAVSAIRTANRKIVILAGLATNHPKVQTAAHLVADYHLALAAGVQGFWLNANNWQQRNQCTAAQGGVGCPQVGVQFLADIGLAASLGAASPPATSTSTTSPRPAATRPSPATTPRQATTSSQAAGTQQASAPKAGLVPLALDSPLGGIVGVLALIAGAGLVGWMAHRRPDAS